MQKIASSNIELWVDRICTVGSVDMALTAPHATRTLALNGLTITATLSRNAVTMARKCRQSCNTTAANHAGKHGPSALSTLISRYRIIIVLVLRPNLRISCGLLWTRPWIMAFHHTWNLLSSWATVSFSKTVPNVLRWSDNWLIDILHCLSQWFVTCGVYFFPVLFITMFLTGYFHT